MCADYTPSRKDQIEESFRTSYPLLDLPPEAWPGYMAPVLRGSHEASGEMEVAAAMFGIVPHWADHKLARQTYNARAETVASKPSFRSAWKRKHFASSRRPTSSSPTTKPASPCAGESSALTVVRWPLPASGNSGRRISCCRSRC